MRAAPFELLPKYRAAFLRGDAPHVPLTPGEAKAIEPGQIITLERFRFWLVLDKPQRDPRGGWFLVYTVNDHRPRLIRRHPHGMDVTYVRTHTDAYGTPLRVSEQDEAEAEEASHYTSHQHQAVVEADEAVPRDVQELFSAEAEVKRARGDSDRVRGELDRIKRLPPRARLAELHKLADDRGVDVRDEVKAFERRLLRRLDRAA